jgi:hypothetical protein
MSGTPSTGHRFFMALLFELVRSRGIVLDPFGRREPRSQKSRRVSSDQLPVIHEHPVRDVGRVELDSLHQRQGRQARFIRHSTCGRYTAQVKISQPDVLEFPVVLESDFQQKGPLGWSRTREFSQERRHCSLSRLNCFNHLIVVVVDSNRLIVHDEVSIDR